MKLYKDGLGICALRVTYTDDSGYVSVIQTDLRIKVPEIDFSQAVTVPSITGISMIAQDSIQALPTDPNLPSQNEIGGSFYADRFIVGSTKEGEGGNPECRSVWRTVGGINHHAWWQSDQGRQ